MLGYRPRAQQVWKHPHRHWCEPSSSARHSHNQIDHQGEPPYFLSYLLLAIGFYVWSPGIQYLSLILFKVYSVFHILMESAMIPQHRLQRAQIKSKQSVFPLLITLLISGPLNDSFLDLPMPQFPSSWKDCNTPWGAGRVEERWAVGAGYGAWHTVSLRSQCLVFFL